MTTPTYFKVDKFSHHFVVSQISPITGPTILGFVRDYIQYGIARVNGVYKRMPLKVFAARDKSTNSFRLHNGVWDEFWRYCSNNNISKEKIDITEWAHAPAQPIEIPVRQGWVPKDYQEPIIEYLLSPKPSHVKMVEIQPGAGKAGTLTSKIKTPGGWSTMGEMKVGTTVTAWDGTPSKVTGVFPQGVEKTYRVFFSDGRSTVVSGEHLWRIYYKVSAGHPVEFKTEVVNTLLLIEMKDSVGQVYIDLIKPEIVEETSVPLDPYLLGQLLSVVSPVNSVKFNTPAFFTEDYTEALTSLGLKKDLSNKHVPENYINGSIDQRLSLLHGLFDTSSHINHFGITWFTDSSELLSDIQYMVRSLGGWASKTQTHEGYFALRVQFNNPKELSKTNAFSAVADGLAINRGHLALSDIREEGEQETQCISIDHPDKLYVTDDFIVTHNTFCAMAALAQYSTRFVAVLKPKYVEKWVDDVVKITESVKSDVLVVAGQAGLMKLLAAALSNELEERVVIVSNRTLQNWISLYEEKGDETLTLGYSCRPHEFFPLLKAGTRLVDEVHEDFHLNFKIDLYTHVPVSISLSATLISDDPFVAKMQEIAYPKSIRYTGLPYDRYIHSFAVMYNVSHPELIRTTEYGSTTYSHHVFEQSIMKHKHFLVSYLAMIKDLAERYFFSTFQGGDRLLIYCTSIKMCTIVTDYLLREYPKVDIRRYVEKDPYENLMNARVSVSTIQSAGTGHDIAGLMTVIMTPAVSSRGSNIQGYGRLRKVPDRQTQFIYTTCTDVPKHIKYHEQREMLLKIMAKEHFLLENQYTVG